MLRIDADAHVLETEETWEFMDGADRKYRPEVVGSTNGWRVRGRVLAGGRNPAAQVPQRRARTRRWSPVSCATWP